MTKMKKLNEILNEEFIPYKKVKIELEKWKEKYLKSPDKYDLAVVKFLEFFLKDDKRKTEKTDEVSEINFEDSDILEDLKDE